METQEIVDRSALDGRQCEEQSTVVIQLEETPPALSLLEQREAMDPSHSHQRSPEFVLFESQPSEIMCCEELSPKIVPRLTKIRLNLDIPENDSASEEQDLDKTNSLSEKTGLDYDCPANAQSDKACENQALEKTLSIDKAFPINLETIDASTLRQVPSDESSCCPFTNSHDVLPLNNVMDGNMRDFILNGRQAQPLAQYAGGVESSEVFACSTGLEATSIISSKNQESRNFDEAKACNYFDVPLSTEPQELAQTSVNDKPGNGLESELPWISEVHWYTQTGREIFPNDQQLELLKIHGAPDVKKSRKQKTCEKSRKFGENDANEYFRTRNGSPPAKRCRTTLRFDDVEQTNSMFPPVAVHRPLGTATKEQADECSDENVKIDWGITSQSPVSVELPVVSDSDFKTMVVSIFAVH